MRFAAEASTTEGTRDERSSCPRLHALLRASQFCELSCRRAADRVRDVALAELLLRQAHERARFSREIDTELSALGVEPPSGRDSGDHLIEPWGPTDGQNVVQCVRAHVELLAAYEQVHAAALPQDVEAVLERQRVAIARGLEALRGMTAGPPTTRG